MADVHEPDSTSLLPGIYANRVEVTVQPDSMVRITFQDIVGGSPIERAHIVMTTEGAHILANVVQTMLQPSVPASAAN